MKRARLLLLVLPILWAGCGPGASRPDASSSARGAEARPAAFEPPADGRLTAAQVDMYIAVRTKALRDSPVPAVKRGEIDAARLASVVTADLEAAGALGYDPDEYRWVKARVLEARPLPADAVAPSLARAAAASLEGLKRMRDASEDPAAVARLDEQIAGREASRADGGRARSEGTTFNEKLLGGYDEKLRSLDAAARPPTSP